MDDLGKITYQFRKNKNSTTVVLCGVPMNLKSELSSSMSWTTLRQSLES